MKISHLLSASALASAFAFGPAAFAQTTPTAEQCAADPALPNCATPTTGTAPLPTETQIGQPNTVSTQNADGSADERSNEVVVTGSRIRRPNLDSAVPITSIGGEQLFQQADTNVGETLNDLPQLRSTFSQQNPNLGVGIAGLNLLDLRGLGTARTLVLVNGRRHVPADILNNAASPDVNSIPNDLIERIDIVTGSQSATYGSDAIAGVVNFVLRRNYDGVQLRSQLGATDRGFGGNQYISSLVGKNFAGGRGNVTLHGEYSHQDRVFGSDIKELRRVDSLGQIDVDPTGLPGGSDGFPDRVFLRDIRSASINRYGLIPINQRPSVANCGVGLGQTNGAAAATGVTTGTPYNCTYLFTQGGQLVQQTGTRYSTGVIGGILGGNGQTGREGQLLSVLPKQNRYNINLLAHYTVSDAFEPFIEAKWNRIRTLGSNAAPSFIQGQQTQLDGRERIRLDNPFLSTADRATLTNLILTSNCNTSFTAACPDRTNVGTAAAPQFINGNLTDAQRAQVVAGSYRFVLGRQLADSGIRDEDFRRDTYRIVGGFRGNFNDDWSYEISANYGKFKENTTTYGYLDRQRFLLSLDSGRNPVTGQIQCRSQFDTASATAFTQGLDATQIAAQRARLASDIAACVPYNPFGGADNSAAANYFVYNARHKASLSQLDFSGFVSGDLSQLFELPGGPIGFAVGGEYRRERARYNNDPFVESGATNAVIIGEFDPPSFVVKEAYGEVRVPLLKDLPLIRELSLNGAGRVSDYKGSVGTVWTWNYGGEYAPVNGLRFRASYGKAVRAPNVSETGFPAVPNFASFTDPCASGQIANNPNRSANCLTDLGATLLAGLPNVTYSLPIISGSNPNLSPEKSRSLTVGGVFQPSFIPGLSLSVDYFNIKVDGVIVSLSAQQIANGCYDQPTLNNPLCAVFTRFRGPGVGPFGELPGQVLGNSLVSAPVNFAKRIRRGLDTNFNYRVDLGANARINTNVVYTHNLKSSNYENPSLPDFENRVLSELGNPKNEFQWDTDLTLNQFTFSYRLHYIGPQYVNAYEDFNELPAACTAAGCPPNNTDYADIRTYHRVYYHNLRFSWDLKNRAGVGTGYRFYAGVDNLLNTYPPLGATGTAADAAIYDVRGRAFYAGFRAQF